MSFITARGVTSAFRQVDFYSAFVDYKNMRRYCNLKINAINNDGTAVGTYWDSGHNATMPATAIIAEAAASEIPAFPGIIQAERLSFLLAEQSLPWQLINAVDINNSGQIVATEQLNNQLFSFLLTPR